MSSLALASLLTPSPRTKSLLSTSSTPKLATKTTLFSPSPFKLQTSHIASNKSFHNNYAVTPSTTDVLTSTDNSRTTLTNEQWAVEHGIISQQIKEFIEQIQQISPEEIKHGGSNKALDDILNDFYTLVGNRVANLAPNNAIPTTGEEITKTMMDIGGYLQSLATSNNNGIVPVDPIPFPGDLSNTIDKFVQIVAHLVYGKKTENDTTAYYLTGNFAPVRQENPPTTKVEITTGTIPPTLNGMMLRNGPDPQFDPEVNYVWLDGDSMIHGIRFKDGAATYVSRYVGTSRYIQEGDFDRAQIIRYGDLEGAYGYFAIFIQWLRYKLQILDMSFGFNMSNDAMIYHNGRIMAVNDFGQPFALSVDKDTGDIKSLGINNYDGVLTNWFNPHPKKDPNTGEMFGFGSMYTKPHCIYYHISADGKMSKPVNITVSSPTYMHDLGLTAKYVVIMDLPYVFSPETMAARNDWVYVLDPCKTPRFGVLHRHAKNEDKIKWFEFENDPFFIYHNANSWEDEDGNIVLYGCAMNPKIHPKTKVAYLSPLVSRRREKCEVDLTLPQLHKFTFNMTTMKATRKLVTETTVDYPKINESYISRQNQYVYASEVNSDSKIPSIRKYDLNETDVTKIETPFVFGDGIYGSEVVFVPNDSPISEDDGYLITFAHNEKTDVSYAYVINAQSMKPVTTIKLPNRVPYGFHALFVTEDELQAQITQ